MKGPDTVERRDFAPKEKRRFLPEPIETTHKSNKPVTELPTPEATPTTGGIPQTPQETPKPRKARFAPQLIESSRRSKKAGDAAPATLPTDKVRCESADDEDFNSFGIQTLRT